MEDFCLIPDRAEVAGRKLARSLIGADLDHLLEQNCPPLMQELTPGCVSQPIQPGHDRSEFLPHSWGILSNRERVLQQFHTGGLPPEVSRMYQTIP